MVLDSKEIIEDLVLKKEKDLNLLKNKIIYLFYNIYLFCLQCALKFISFTCRGPLNSLPPQTPESQGCNKSTKRNRVGLKGEENYCYLWSLNK